MSVNKVIILGNLGRDPEVSYTQSGVAITKLAVATSESWPDKRTGEKKEKTEWHRITFFDKKAEVVGQHFQKGSKIYVEGKIQTSQYEKDGETRYSTEIIGQNFDFIDKKSNQQQPMQPQQQGFQQPMQPQQGFQQQPMQPQQGFQQPMQPQQPAIDDDIPF